MLTGSRWSIHVNMSFSDEDQILTENLYVFKGYGVKKSKYKQYCWYDLQIIDCMYKIIACNHVCEWVVW